MIGVAEKRLSQMAFAPDSDFGAAEAEDFEVDIAIEAVS